MTYEYRFSGTLPEDSSTYIKRAADDNLYKSLKAGKFCYVLNSRQTGKSSLRVQTMRRLQKDGIICVSIDLSMFDTYCSSPEQWYADIIDTLVQRADLDFDLDAWWDEQKNISPIRLFSKFIEKVLLQQIHQKIVIFIDEIDSILSLKFPCDDFFAFIRGCYNLRADNPIYNRLTFCLLGVATPRDLIADIKRTPFNIGQAIELTPFSLEEVTSSSLIKGLLGKVENPKAVLEEIWYWTNGQPFITQKLCNLIVNHLSDNSEILEEDKVSQIIHNQIIDNWEYQDEPQHLKTIRDRILNNDCSASRLLGIYQGILQNGEIARNRSSEQVELCLSGLVIKCNGSLKIYNRIYKSIFNLSWVDKQLASLRPYSESFNRWLTSGYKDESRLLRGQALEDALNWSKNKNLSIIDYKFLAESQEYENKEFKEAGKKGKKLLQQAKKQANRQIKFGALISVLLIIASVFFTHSLRQDRKRLLAINDIQSSANTALRLFDFQQIEALSDAIRIADKSQKRVKDTSSENYLNSSTISTLNYILDNIKERNQLKHQDNNEQVTSVNISPNRKYIVTASTDNTAKIWNLSGNEIATLEHEQKVNKASFSPNSEYVVTASVDGTAKIWDLYGHEIATLQHDKDYNVSRAIFSPDSQRIITLSYKGEYDYEATYKITFWNSQNYEKISSLEFQQNKDRKFKVIDAVFTPQKRLVIVTASEKGIVQLLDEQGKLIQELIGHEKGVINIAFSPDSPDGQLIATASIDNTVRLWKWEPNDKLNDKENNLIQVLKGHTGYVNDVSFSSDGQLIATTSNDNTIRLWKKDDNQTLYASEEVLRGHKTWVYGVVFAPDDKQILTASADNTARIWELSSEKKANILQETDIQSKVFTVAFSPDKKLIATGSADGKVRLWNNQNGKWIKYREWKVEEYSVYSVIFSPDGKQIATGSRDGKVRLWNLEGELIKVLHGHEEWESVESVAFSPDGKQIVSGSRDGTARLWNKNGKPIAILKGHKDWVQSVAFSPDGNYILTGSRDNTARLWNKNGKFIKELKRHENWVQSVVFSPDGQQILTGDRNGIIRLWDRNGRFIQTLEGYQYSIKDIAFSPNGQLIATASYDGTVRLWNRKGNLMLQELSGHGERVNSIAFSPDSKQIVTGSHDGTARLWSVVSLEQLINDGCIWLKDYFVTNPEELKRLEVCHQYIKRNVK
ncbi:MAG: AAA-like domain-containing protein [Rivularia sp. (in: Bacteria)]|nr:AAA-like domain-containing protein [Rivularia sp. MS3]